MKPDWSSAPEWAAWLAMDSSGEWFWYEFEPRDGGHYWSADNGRVETAFEQAYWRDTLEQKP